MSHRRVRIEGEPTVDLGCLSWILLFTLGGCWSAAIAKGLHARAEAIRSLPQ